MSQATIPASSEAAHPRGRDAGASYKLPPDVRDKLVQIALLVGDVIEGVMQGREAHDGASTRHGSARRRGTRTAYVPPESPSEIDRARARRLLASKGLTEASR